ncbi:MAG: acyltransferase [Gammaproteobacteria bacterium]|nr:acyltransferase [Gammaproteobacteria bacterium]
MAYLTTDQLAYMGFKSLGVNVKISDKASIYGAETIEIGDNSRIDDFCVVSGNVVIGRFVHVAPFCLLAGGSEGIIMEDFSGLAYQVQVFSQSDDYSGRTLTNPTVPSKYKNEMKRPVRLGRHVIVGSGSIVFPGVHVAEGCSVGAMTLVSKSTDSWGIYVGNPARRVKERKKNLLELEIKFLEEFYK